MKRIMVLCILALSGHAICQVPWSQPWAAPLPAWPSTVTSAANPTPLNDIACDDFFLGAVTPVAVFKWWGVVSKGAQLTKPFYICIYRDNGFGSPNFSSIAWSGSLAPTTVIAGVDANGNQVHQFTAGFAQPVQLILLPGTYWIQISEDDSSNVTRNAVDFWWSSHQGVNLTPALSKNNLGFLNRPLVDSFNGANDDLAFEIL